MVNHRLHPAQTARLIAGPLTVLVVLLMLASSAHAAGVASCRASASRSELLNLPINEPTVANAANSPCSSQDVETVHPTTLGVVNADAVQAITASGATAENAFAGVSQPRVGLGAVSISAEKVQSAAAATCSGATPALSSSSSVVGLKIGNQSVVLPSNDSPQSLPLPGGGTLAVNQESRSGDEVVRQALVVDLPGVGQVVLAETRAAIDSLTCSTHSGDGEDPNPTDVCPQGSLYDAPTGRCVIHDGTRVIVVGRPFQGPSGGTVLPLDQARKLYKSPCLSGAGLPYAVVGTTRADHITGTNGADRILVLAGADRVDGGRGRDCLDGGNGNDTVAGGLDADRLYGGNGRDSVLGGAGNDHVWGGAGADTVQSDGGNDTVDAGAGDDRVVGDGGNDLVRGGPGNDQELGNQGNDRLYGQAGNDFLSSGRGRDRLYGGAGRDRLTAIFLGPAATLLDGGPGRDSARFNRVERRHVRSVERRRVFG